MNIRFKSRYLVLLLSATVFFSCKKDDTTSPTPPEEKPALFETVQGKWGVHIDPPARVSGRSIVPKSKASMKVQDIGEVTSIEFFKDSTCMIVFNYTYGYSHKIDVKDSTTFNFGEFGDLSNIKVAGDSISFNFTYYDQLFSIKAAKIADVVLADDKKSLINEWLVTREEDGDSLYDKGSDFPEGTQIYLQFTPGGTFAQKIVYGDQSMIMAYNWKWKANKTDAISFYAYDEDQDAMNGSFIKIVSLSASTLKIQLIDMVEEVYRNNGSAKVSGDPNYVEKVQYNLVLTKK